MSNDLPLAIALDREPISGIGRRPPTRFEKAFGWQWLDGAALMRVDQIEDDRNNPDVVVRMFERCDEGE
jgi:hypothetical protein